MALADLIAQNSVLPALKANSKKQLLQELAAKASEVTGLAEREVFDVILQRERLGSTGVGNGIAIPHGKLASLDKIVGVFARLDQPVDFEALDDQPVDLVFLLLAPEGAGADHLKALSRIARVMRDSDMVAKLRATDNAASLHAFLTEEPASNAGPRALSELLENLNLQMQRSPEIMVISGLRVVLGLPGTAGSHDVNSPSAFRGGPVSAGRQSSVRLRPRGKTCWSDCR